MVEQQRKLISVGEIDATGVKGPHEKELEDISDSKCHLFINLEGNLLKGIIEDEIGGKIENIGLSEDWAISIEMFPEVNIHMAYSYFGDEFGDGKEAEFKFLFSGERVSWVPGEDSATFIDIVMDFIERKIKDQKPFEKDYDNKTELMVKVLEQRSGPFTFLMKQDKKDLEDFLGAIVLFNENLWTIKKEVFPKIFIEIIWDNNNSGLDIKFSGEKLTKNIDKYHIEFVGIFMVNHILRFITINNPNKDLPEICYKMFSRHYSKLKNWDHR